MRVRWLRWRLYRSYLFPRTVHEHCSQVSNPFINRSEMSHPLTVKARGRLSAIRVSVRASEFSHRGCYLEMPVSYRNLQEQARELTKVDQSKEILGASKCKLAMKCYLLNLHARSARSVASFGSLFTRSVYAVWASLRDTHAHGSSLHIAWDMVSDD